MYFKPNPAPPAALFESLSPASVGTLDVGCDFNVVISLPAPTFPGCLAVRDGVGRMYIIGFSRLLTPRSVAPWLVTVSPGRIIFGPMSGLGTRPACLQVSFVLISPFSFTEQEKMCGLSVAMSPRPTQACRGERSEAGSQGPSFWPSFSYISFQNFILLLLCIISSNNQKLLAVKVMGI